MCPSTFSPRSLIPTVRCHSGYTGENTYLDTLFSVMLSLAKFFPFSRDRLSLTNLPDTGEQKRRATEVQSIHVTFQFCYIASSPLGQEASVTTTFSCVSRTFLLKNEVIFF